MTLYLVTFCLLRGGVLLEGPTGFDFQAALVKWHDPDEPNVEDWRSHGLWAIRHRADVLHELGTSFVDHLVEVHGFRRMSYRHVEL